MKDWLGQTIEPGDYVTYAQINGRAANIIVGKVHSFTDNGNIRLVPKGGSRWKGHSAQRYIDSRTGKGIDPSYEKHQERGYGYVNQVTGEFKNSNELHRFKILNYDEVYDERGYVRRQGGSHYGSIYGKQLVQEIPNPAYVKEDWKFSSPVYKDYVTLDEEGATVTLQITQNITKVPTEVVEGWLTAQAAAAS